MRSAIVPTATVIDFKESLLETFATNEQANQLLLSNIDKAVWLTAPPSGKGRTIRDISTHIHNVRVMWLSAADKNGKHPSKLDPDKATREQVQTALKNSALAIQGLIRKAAETPAGKVSNFKPDVVGSVGYMIAHDAHHRGQISMIARQLGYPLSAKINFGLWEWGTLWREASFGQ